MVCYLTSARFTGFTVEGRMFESTLPPAGGKTQTPGVTGASFDQTCQKLPNMASRNASGHPVPKLTPKQR